jgi:hypothetical protein
LWSPSQETDATRTADEETREAKRAQGAESSRRAS